MADRVEPAVEALPERWASRWNRTLEWMGLGMVFIPVGERLWDCYAAAGRFHHDPRHALACVKALEDYPGSIADQDALELALWFHDAAYSARATPCESRAGSVEIFCREFQLLAGDLVDINEVCRLITATRHHREPQDRDEALAMDIDLLILASENRRYDVYAGEIRREYQHIDDQGFCQQRAEYLRTFMRRKSIFWTRHFRRLHEKRAGANIERELSALLSS
ncbi:MAG: hypothetical protein MK183_13570 [Verrucomicrobiales bacterium]|nr:hypothetical protein [Verrucomicrobiales bacterium]